MPCQRCAQLLYRYDEKQMPQVPGLDLNVARPTYRTVFANDQEQGSAHNEAMY